jgi:hypothetical protein
MKTILAFTLIAFVSAESPTITASFVQLFVAVAIVVAAFMYQTNEAQQ